MQYLSRYVQVSNYRKQLYHRIFSKYIPEIKLDDFGEINLPDWNSSPERRGRDLSCVPLSEAKNGCAPSRTDLINHGIPATSPCDASAALTISELYMNKRFIPFDQLKAALTTVLCPSASTEIIENILDMLLLSDAIASTDGIIVIQRINEETDDVTEKYHISGEDKNRRVDEILRNALATKTIARNPNGIIINMSTSPAMSSLSATDYVRDELSRDGSGKLNISCDNNRKGKDGTLDGKFDSGKTSNDCNGNVFTSSCSSSVGVGQSHVSFAGTAARVVALSNSAAQFGIGGGAMNCASTDDDNGGMATTTTDRASSSCCDKEVVFEDGDEFLTEEIKINFRTWCGIVAFAERYTTNILKENDTRHEVREVELFMGYRTASLPLYLRPFPGLSFSWLVVAWKGKYVVLPRPCIIIR